MTVRRLRALPAVALVFACSAGPEPSSGQGAGGSECNAAPSFELEVEPLLLESCGPCHAQGQARAGAFVLTGDSLRRRREDVVVLVENGVMPPPDELVLEGEDRELLLRWLACSAPPD